MNNLTQQLENVIQNLPHLYELEKENLDDELTSFLQDRECGYWEPIFHAIYEGVPKETLISEIQDYIQEAKEEEEEEE